MSSVADPMLPELFTVLRVARETPDTFTLDLGRFDATFIVREIRDRFYGLPVGSPFVIANIDSVQEVNRRSVLRPTVLYLRAGDDAGRLRHGARRQEKADEGEAPGHAARRAGVAAATAGRDPQRSSLGHRVHYPFLGAVHGSSCRRLPSGSGNAPRSGAGPGSAVSPGSAGTDCPHKVLVYQWTEVHQIGSPLVK